MTSKLQVMEQETGISQKDGLEYICITDIARYKNAERTEDLIRNWLRNRNTIEFLGIRSSSTTPILIPSNSTGLKVRQV